MSNKIHNKIINNFISARQFTRHSSEAYNIVMPVYTYKNVDVSYTSLKGVI